MLGNLMMLASGRRVNLPKMAKLLGMRCASGNMSENSPKIRAASEMSLASTSTPAGDAKVRMTGKKAAVASKGASSVSV